MTRVRRIDASTCLAFAVAGLYLLGIAAPLGAPQEGSNLPPPALSRRPDSTKPAWPSGPASTPPQTEVVRPPSEAPPPAKSPLLGAQVEGKKPTVTKPRAVTPAGSGFATRRTPAAAHELTPTPNASLYDDSNPPDPEAQRIRDEFSRLRDDAGARSAFYDELRRTVEQVRAGLRDEENPPSSGPGWHRFHDASGEPPNPPANQEPNESPPANTEPPQASLGRHRGSLSDQPSPLPLGGVRFLDPGGVHRTPEIGEGGPPPAFSSAGAGRVRGSRFANATVDRAAYRRVVQYAKANGTPVPLALGVAWIESRLRTYPPRGAAGEVGMFQILPARCRLEGWPPQRLKEPEFNAWLGTRLLARYYQEEGSWARAAAKYVAGPKVFDRSYSQDLWAYINWYASSVDSYAGYFSRYPS
ncbi:MAG: transglycosylase SLT domain-containing protein [Terriglobia bacterium]|jgi:hypothetical protein